MIKILVVKIIMSVRMYARRSDVLIFNPVIKWCAYKNMLIHNRLIKRSESWNGSSRGTYQLVGDV